MGDTYNPGPWAVETRGNRGPWFAEDYLAMVHRGSVIPAGHTHTSVGLTVDLWEAAADIRPEDIPTLDLMFRDSCLIRHEGTP